MDFVLVKSNGIYILKDEDKNCVDGMRLSKKGLVGFFKKRIIRRLILKFGVLRIN